MNANALVVVTQALQSPEMRDQFAALLPKEVPIDRFTEVATMAIRQNPELLDADRSTLYDGCLQLARRGLLPDKKEAALVIFNTKEKINGKDVWSKKVQAMAMVEGIIKELGKVGVPAYAVSVYEGETIELWNDDEGQHVRHVPSPFKRGARIGAFAAGRMPNGRTYVEVMSMEDLERVALRSKQARKDNDGKPVGRGGTWKSDPERMEQKSCLHRLRKRIPILEPVPEDSESDFDPSVVLPDPSEPAAQASDEPPVNQSEQKMDPPVAQGRRRPQALRAVLQQAQAQAPEPPPEQEEPPMYSEDDII